MTNGKVWPKSAVSYADRGLNFYIGIQYYILEVTIEAPNLLWRTPAFILFCTYKCQNHLILKAMYILIQKMVPTRDELELAPSNPSHHLPSPITDAHNTTAALSSRRHITPIHRKVSLMSFVVFLGEASNLPLLKPVQKVAAPNPNDLPPHDRPKPSLPPH